MFQFQYGTIKREMEEGLICWTSKFQFQYGTIKRMAKTNIEMKITRFNSSMVRLKEFVQVPSYLFLCRFQFQYGTIKSFNFAFYVCEL